MKTIYKGYFKPSESDFSKLWEQGVFVCDANVLLNLYRYSEETCNSLLDILESLNDRIWVPRKVTDEFFDNRFEVLGKQINGYIELNKQLTNIENLLNNKRQHPFIAAPLLDKLIKLFNEVRENSEHEKEALLERLTNDPILERLGELFNNKIGDGLQTDMDAFYAESKARVEQSIPPGFIDAKNKEKSGDNYRIYGDVILWQELIDKAKLERHDIIFITDDGKEDWWLKSQGRTISPLPALIKEFSSKTEQSFYMYSVDSFIEYASDYLKRAINVDIIKEVRDVSENFKRQRNENLYRVISEEELCNELEGYEEIVKDIDPSSYVGLRNFVTNVLGGQGYEINHSYALINNLVSKGRIKLIDRHTHVGTVKEITLDHGYDKSV